MPRSDKAGVVVLALALLVSDLTALYNLRHPHPVRGPAFMAGGSPAPVCALHDSPLLYASRRDLTDHLFFSPLFSWGELTLNDGCALCGLLVPAPGSPPDATVSPRTIPRRWRARQQRASTRMELAETTSRQ